MNETHRQLAHVAAGTAVLVSVLTWGGQETLAALIALVCAGMAFATVKLLGFSLGPLEKLLARFERAKATPFQGAITLMTGCLFALTFSPSIAFGLAAIAILAFGDGAATLFGKGGRAPIPWNSNKTWRGSLAFCAIGGLAALPFIGITAFGYAGVLALIESIDLQVDDNIVIPVAAVLLKLV